MKVQLEMEREQFERVLQMVYLGEYVIRSCGCDEEGQSYGDVADSLYAKRYAAEYGLSEREAEENAEGDQSMPVPVHPHTHGYLAESAKIPSHKDL